MRLLISAAVLAALLVTPALGNNLSNVDDPDVTAGQVRLEYRAALAPNGDEDADFAHKFFGEAALNDSWKLRLGFVQERVLDVSESEGIETENYDFDPGHSFKLRSFEPEVWWQMREAQGHGLDLALIFKGYIPNQGHGPGQAALAVAAGTSPNPKTRLLLNLEAGHWIGDQAPDGYFLSSRAEANYALCKNLAVGAQIYDEFGSTDGFEPFHDGNSHQLGPVARLNLFKNVTLTGNVLFGLTEGSPDTEFRTFLSVDL